MKTTANTLMLAGLLASLGYTIHAADKACPECMPAGMKCPMNAAAGAEHEHPAKPADPATKPAEPAKPSEPAKPAEPAKKAYPLTTCVVSGKALGDHGKPVVFQHNGVEVQLCCKSCKKDFLKDPAKYLKMIEDAGKKTEPAKPAEPAK